MTNDNAKRLELLVRFYETVSAVSSSAARRAGKALRGDPVDDVDRRRLLIRADKLRRDLERCGCRFDWGGA